MALEFECKHCGEIKYARFLKVGELADCKSCGKKTTIPENSKVIRTSDMPQILKDIGKEDNNKNNEDNKDLNIKEHNIKKEVISRGFKEYPAMETLALIFDIFTFIALLIGIIVISFLLITITDTTWYGIILVLFQIVCTALAILFLKFISESIKILCDIAYYLKSIDKKI